MPSSIRFAGILLCGGDSRRMGRPKAWLPFGATTMLQHLAGVLRSVVSPIVVVAAPEQDVPAVPDALVVRDAVPGRGPLQGLAAGLKALQGQADAAFVSSCDSPLLKPAFVRRLCQRLAQHVICVPWAHGRHHPLAAVYRLDVVPLVDKLLADNRLRTVDLLQEADTLALDAGEFADIDPGLDSLRNVNTPEEYQAILREALA